MILSWPFRGFPVPQMNSMVPRTHLGRLLAPKPGFLIMFKGFPDFLENWWDPGTPHVYFLLPLGLFPLLGVYDGFMYTVYSP